MKIAVDARELTGRPTGVGRYLWELLTEWSRLSPARATEWRIYAPATPTVPESFQSQIRLLPGDGGTRWEQFTLRDALIADPPDVLFAPGYTSPLRARWPTVVTVHDVSFAAHPEWFGFREGARRRVLTALSARRATVVLTDSAFSRGELVRHLRVPAERIRTIPLGIRVPSRPAAPSKTEPLILYVGSIFQRRHVDVLIAAFATHVAAHVPASRLEIVGENRSYPRLDFAQLLGRLPSDVRSRITMRSYVDEPTLQDLYSRACVFAFPSEYEGFGLPPLEALAAGIPVVALDTAVACEVLGAAARYVAATPAWQDDLGDALLRLMTSDTARHDVLRQAPAVLARYSWDRTAEATFAALQEAGRG